MNPLVNFAGKVAIVTGGTRGIGLATAKILGQAGARVVISSRKPASAQEALAALRELRIEAVNVTGHAANPEDCERLVATALAAFGRLDTVVANAAVNPVFDPLTGISDEAWSKTLDTNVRGPLYLARAALPRLPNGSGSMVVVSSINAQLGVPNSGAYGVSKAALEQMTRQLAVEWGSKGIRINAVSPGTTRTDMIRALVSQPGFVAAVEGRTPLRRIGEPEDVGAVIAFLASNAARHVTGQVVTVDGGETIARSTS
ncbi:MAG TPA: SDR family oxidoreductase [Steroidobacteraceae bacterium]|nr:SDR family oxidoreductase [Steroidobacteraceae bacterium]